MKMPQLIIERPEWQSFGQRTLYASITLVFWAAWGYLWIPLITFLAWAMGFGAIYDRMVMLDGHHGLLQMLGIYSLVVLLLGGSLLLWAMYNYIRFRGVDRRRPRSAVEASVLGPHYHLDPAMLSSWQQAKRLVIHHDLASNVTGVETSAGSWFRSEQRLPPRRRMPMKHIGKQSVSG